MDTTQIPGLNQIPEPWRSRVVFAFAASLIAGRVFRAVSILAEGGIKAIVSAGGLKTILSSIWFGTNTPKQQTENQNKETK